MTKHIYHIHTIINIVIISCKVIAQIGHKYIYQLNQINHVRIVHIHHINVQIIYVHFNVHFNMYKSNFTGAFKTRPLRDVLGVLLWLAIPDPVGFGVPVP